MCKTGRCRLDRVSRGTPSPRRHVDGAPSKFWTTFAKRKFMNKAL